MSTVPRIYQPYALRPNQLFTLTSEAAHHLVRVLRLPLGASFTVFNGEGSEFRATLQSIKKNSVEALIESSSDVSRESPLVIHLGQGISRAEKMDFVLQKATELGVTKITPLLTERVHLPQAHGLKRARHWCSVIVSACEQCGRNIVPSCSLPMHMDAWLAENTSALKLILDPQGSTSLQDYDFSQVFGNRAADIALLVGPEGGFSENEIALAVKNNFKTLRVGPRVLRTETAALAVIAFLQGVIGDMR